MKTDKIIQIGQIIDGDGWDNCQIGRIYSIAGIAPTINTMDGGGREPKIMEIVTMNRIIILGNYKPSRHNSGNIHHIDGISSTVMENHGAVIAIMEVREYEDNNSNKSNARLDL